jgi:hypothetical protein
MEGRMLAVAVTNMILKTGPTIAQGDASGYNLVLMDSLAFSLSYQTMELVTSLHSLIMSYPNYIRIYDHADLEWIKIIRDISFYSSMKHVVRVVGWIILGVEVSLNLAQYLVTREGKDGMGHRDHRSVQGALAC